MNTIAWSTPTTPLPTEANPRVVFERMFGDGGTLAERQAELRQNASILDGLTSSMTSLQRKLGAGDRTRVTNYLDSLREVERRIQRAEQQGSDSLPMSAGPSGWRAAELGRPCEIDVRSAGAGVSGRHHAGHYVPDGSRGQHPNLPADRCARCASSDVAPPAGSGEDSQAGEDQRVSRLAVRLFPGAVEVDGRRQMERCWTTRCFSWAAVSGIPMCTITPTCRLWSPAAGRVRTKAGVISCAQPLRR